MHEIGFPFSVSLFPNAFWYLFIPFPFSPFPFFRLPTILDPRKYGICMFVFVCLSRSEAGARWSFVGGRSSRNRRQNLCAQLRTDTRTISIKFYCCSLALSVGRYWAWKPTATLPSAGAVGSAARGASAPTEGGEWRGHILAAACLQLVCLRKVICACLFIALRHDLNWQVFWHWFSITRTGLNDEWRSLSGFWAIWCSAICSTILTTLTCFDRKSTKT